MGRVAVIGPGAIGGVMDGWLWRGGRHDVTLCARRPLGSFVIETPSESFRASPNVVTRAADAAPADFVLVATKTYDAEATSGWFPRLCAEGAPVAVLQNGVEHRERFSRSVPIERIVPVLVDCRRSGRSRTA